MMASRLTHDTGCNNHWSNGDMISSGQYGLVLQKFVLIAFSLWLLLSNCISVFKGISSCGVNTLTSPLLIIHRDRLDLYSLNLFTKNHQLNCSWFRVEKFDQNKLDFFIKLNGSCLYYSHRYMYFDSVSFKNISYDCCIFLFLN